MKYDRLDIHEFSEKRKQIRTWNKLFRHHSVCTPEYMTDREALLQKFGIIDVSSLLWMTDRYLADSIMGNHGHNVTQFDICTADRITIRQLNQFCDVMVNEIDAVQRLKLVANKLAEVSACPFYVIQYSDDKFVYHIGELHKRIDSFLKKIDKYVVDDTSREFPHNHETPTILFREVLLMQQFSGLLFPRNVNINFDLTAIQIWATKVSK